MKKLIILGYGGTCFDIADVAQATGEFEVLGFLDDSASGILNQYPSVLGPLSKAAEYKDVFFVNGIGSPASFTKRPEILEKLKINNFATLIHPDATVSRTAKIGAGSVIFSQSSIGAQAEIGCHVTVLQNSVIGHDSHIGDFSILAAGVILSGRVLVGANSYLGAGCKVKQDIKIGEKTLVGLGSSVISDIPSKEVWAGTPAKKLK